MGKLLTFPAPDADTAWQRYQELAKAALADPALMADRKHVEATLRAHKAFCDAFQRKAKA